MNVSALRDRLAEDYRHYAERLCAMPDDRIRASVEAQLKPGCFGPTKCSS
jgi:hypothetical protein